MRERGEKSPGGRRRRARMYSAAIVIAITGHAAAATLTLNQKDALVWSQNQLITGQVDTLIASTGLLYLNGVPFPFTVSQSKTFAVSVHLGAGLNRLVATIDSGGLQATSDTLRYTLGYSLRPEIYAYGTASGRSVTLHASIIDNPESTGVAFQWQQDPGNQHQVSLGNTADSVVSFTLPIDAPAGEYYYQVTATTTTGDSVNARACVRLDSSGISPFNIASDHARWIDSAVVYGITPYIFVARAAFRDVTTKIPELASFGVTALWIQPIYSTHSGGQGYDVVDYFGVRTDLGSEVDLRTLVQAAHAHGLKVLFDFVPNHTSIYHPYAQDAILYGTQSHYYNFYERAFDSAAYASDENYRTAGLMTFVYYFWNDLVNLNYAEPEVQRMMIEAGKYWIEKFDIDGYRVDAAWAVNARKPDFMKEWRLALKRLKPEILLLAEDKASQPQVFDDRFDAAYDWASEASWISHWVWQTFYSSTSNPTIFNNTPENQRSAALRTSLNNHGAGYSPSARILRFMENNDTYRFLATHDLPRTKMAAALMFSLDGIPLLYNGQEIGASTHPYSTYEIFLAGASIQSMDSYGLVPYYRRLIQLRKLFPALYSRNFQEIQVTPNSSIFAYRRWEGGQNVFGVLNMGSGSASASLQTSVSRLGFDSTRVYYLSDLMTGALISGTPRMLDTVAFTLNGYTARLFVLADSAVTVSGVHDLSGALVPTGFSVSQNYPNPFNPMTTIRFSIPTAGDVSLKIYDQLGRLVRTLAAGQRAPGSYEVQFDAGGIASGIYFYRVEFRGSVMLKKMMVLR